VGCGVPLCSIGNGKVEDNCFTIAHKAEDQREMVCKKFDKMHEKKRKIKYNYPIFYVQNYTRITIGMSIIRSSVFGTRP
jgi:hypothetical protein